MLDRESTFANPEIISLLTDSFVPVAIDQAYQRRQQDAEGEFYRLIAGQGPRSNFQSTTQGLYVASPDGDFLGFSNNRTPDRILRLLNQSLEEFEPADFDLVERGEVDERYNPEPPEDGLVVRVRAKILGGYEPTSDPWQAIFQSATSRDNLWVRADETLELKDGRIAESLAHRIARFHLVDNTRGEPPMWRENEVRSAEITIDDETINGTFHLETEDGSRGYRAELFGKIRTSDDQLERLEFVVNGTFWGEGRYTGGAPEEPFPLAIHFELADQTDVADAIPPQGSRGWVPGYLNN